MLKELIGFILSYYSNMTEDEFIIHNHIHKM